MVECVEISLDKPVTSLRSRTSSVSGTIHAGQAAFDGCFGGQTPMRCRETKLGVGQNDRKWT